MPTSTAGHTLNYECFGNERVAQPAGWDLGDKACGHSASVSTFGADSWVGEKRGCHTTPGSKWRSLLSLH